MTVGTRHVETLPRCGLARALGVLGAALGLAACGSAPPPVEPTSEFTAEHAAVFEDGVEFIENPEGLDGEWRREWVSQLRARVRLADLVARAAVHTVRVDTGLDRRRTIRLEATVAEVIHGDRLEEVTLAVREGDPGFATVEGQDQHILHREFVVYLKWYRTDSGAVAGHWHLAPASEAIVDATRTTVDRLRETHHRRRVVIQED